MDKYMFRYLFCLVAACAFASQDLITVQKKNVTNNFTQNIFSCWENDTFDMFDQVKDKEGIAIDIGVGIEETAIRLSKNFHHVIAVEPDDQSIEYLQQNHIGVCIRPLSNKTQFPLKTITFNQLLYDYVFNVVALKDRKVSFIKCDIEGREEDVLEDILHFAYNNHCKAYISFHLDGWRSKNISEFAYLFKYFKTNYPGDICEYLAEHPRDSLLFEPLDAGILVKKNMTAVIIGYNQYTFIKNMVQQLEKYTSDIVVIDNASTYQPLLDYYANDYKYTLLNQEINYGSDVYLEDRIQKLLGDVYLLTDPDIKFNPKLPDNFIQDLVEIMNYFNSSRVGFALCIDSDDIRTDITTDVSIEFDETKFWLDPLRYPPDPSKELYKAPIDTTFCLVNRKFRNNHIRVAGDYTCFHIPWHKNFHKQLAEGEYQSVLSGNLSMHWFEILDEE